MESETNSKGLRGVVQLIGSIGVIWLLTFVVMPALASSCASFRTLAEFIDESEIDTGQFYYTDVEIVTKADLGARSTIEYFAGRKRPAQKETVHTQ